MAEQTVTARTGGSLGDTSVSVDAGRGNVLNLCFYSPTTRSEDDDAAWDTAMVACESLLGERTLDRWVGSVSVAPRRPKGLFGSLKRTSRNPTEQVALPDLRATVEAAADQIRGRLPPQPYCRRSEAIERTLFRTDPRHGADCPRQADRMIGNSVDPELWLAAHGGGLFYDERFSRHDETFCYVKIEGLPADEGSEIEARGRLEDAIDAALVSAGLGCHIGGSTGLAHAYIDLALLRADEALPVVRRVLRERGVPQRSWVLFCSSDLEGEWVGIHPNTPPPSLPNV